MHQLDQPNLALLLIGLTDGGRWKPIAACRSADPELFFPVSASDSNPAQVAEAIAVCAGCLVRSQCLDYAIRTRQMHGIWGGMTEEERYRVVQAQLERARPVSAATRT
jgi:WhiB family transcriptional regulator, redox-sensing transcriptional regulator